MVHLNSIEKIKTLLGDSVTKKFNTESVKLIKIVDC